VSDIFQEVDEEVRREQLKKLWEQWGNYLIALVVVVVVGVGGWRGYEYWESKRAAEAGAAFEAAIALSEAGKHAEAEAAFARIAAQGASGYYGLALIREANELSKRDAKAAAALYEKAADDRRVTGPLRDLAALRAGALLIDIAPYDEVRKRLEPLTAGERSFRHSAREFLALAAWKAGDMTAAKRWIDLIVSDAATPSGIRTRAEMLTALIAADSKV
jgi:hypothetical protein